MNSRKFVFALSVEDIPARMQKDAEKRWGVLMQQSMNDHKMAGEYEIEISSRHMIIWGEICSCGESQEYRGPRIGASETAIEAFAKKYNLTKDDCFIKEFTNGSWWFILSKSVSIQQKFTKICEDLANNMTWPQTMSFLAIFPCNSIFAIPNMPI